MSHLIDTSVCIEYLRGRDSRLVNRFHASSPRNIVVCSIVHAELMYGASRSRNPHKERSRVHSFAQLFSWVSFDHVAAEFFSRERVRLESLGQMIGSFDLIIASIALAHRFTVTHNTAEFSRVPGLALEDWQAP